MNETTACKWDTVIPLNEYILVGKKKLEYDKFLMLCYMNGVELDAAKEQWRAEKQIGLWTHFKRVLKPRGAAVLFGSQPFTSALVMSNIKDYRYDWVWNKKNSGSGLFAKSQPLKVTELISVFSSVSHNYYPIMTKGRMRNKKSYGSKEGSVTGEIQASADNYNNLYYPKNVIEISNANQVKKIHPTQKPLSLLEYLIRTYTNLGDTVLDPTFGSGTTGYACVNLDRRFIGIEQDSNYFQLAKTRIIKAQSEPRQLELIQ